MSTRSRIGYLENGKVFSVYCHCDGYLTYNGRVLVESYDTLDKVKELVSLGALSSLGDSIDTTLDYHRWRSEPIQIQTDNSITDYSLNGFNCWEEYLYLFKDGRWYVYVSHDGEWVTVRYALREEESYA